MAKKEVKQYVSHDGAIRLGYLDGELKRVYVKTDDRIDWDGLKHEIELFEEDIKPKYFKPA